jgi:hypothetical protein
MVLEISGLTPSFETGDLPEMVKVDRPKVDCMIGEQMRRKRWGD